MGEDSEENFLSCFITLTLPSPSRERVCFCQEGLRPSLILLVKKLNATFLVTILFSPVSTSFRVLFQSVPFFKEEAAADLDDLRVI